MKWGIWVCGAAMCLIGLPGMAQPDTVPDGEIEVNTFVNFGSAYRDGSVAPVDVLVANNDRDITGHLELSLYSLDDKLTPVYRLPVDSAKGSQKRFRLHCRLAQATHLEVMLYNGRRPALDFAIRTDLRPVAEESLLCLIVDENPGDFNFLYDAVQRADMRRAVHRADLPGLDLGALPDLTASYTPFDMIILGNVEAERIATRHRTLLRQYVERGGVLVVCTGAYASQYRGTWVEELAGVRIGPEESIQEAALAEAVFAGADRVGAAAGMPAVLAPPIPVATGIRRIGDTPILSTWRSLGSGCVIVIGVDAESQALHGCKGYRRIWQEAANVRALSADVNLAAGEQLLSSRLPQQANISIFSRQGIALYLGLYLLLGVFANWGLCSLLKRREWAWVLLTLFSLGFTGYAFVFGTAGRATAQETYQLSCLRLSKDSTVGTLHSTVGVVSARSARYDLPLLSPYALATDAVAGDFYNAWNRRRTGGLGSGRSGRPFQMKQGKTPAIMSTLR